MMRYWWWPWLVPGILKGQKGSCSVRGHQVFAPGEHVAGDARPRGSQQWLPRPHAQRAGSHRRTCPMEEFGVMICTPSTTDGFGERRHCGSMVIKAALIALQPPPASSSLSRHPTMQSSEQLETRAGIPWHRVSSRQRLSEPSRRGSSRLVSA